MSLSASRVIDEYKTNAGITEEIPKVEVLIEAIFNELKTNGAISGASGTVNGACPVAGGPLTLGTLTGGKIS
jgi:hypothetical protein